MDARDYLVTLRLHVDDEAALWDAASARAIANWALSAEEVEDMFGPREDPDIGDCLSLLLYPGTIGGCRTNDWACAPLARRSAIARLHAA